MMNLLLKLVMTFPRPVQIDHGTITINLLISISTEANCRFKVKLQQSLAINIVMR